MGFFGLQSNGPAAPEIRVEHQPGFATLVIDGDPRCSIENRLVPDNQFVLDQFSVFPCYTGLTAEAQITELRVGRERNTFGYVFPATSFRNGAGVESDWPLIYADAAFRKFVNLRNLQEFQAQASLEELGKEPVPLDKVLDDSLSLLVVSDEILEKHGLQEHLLDILLRRMCISICDSRRDLAAGLPVAEYQSGLNLHKPRLDLSKDLVNLCILLKNADRDNSEIGKFVQYYQFVEYMISKVFEWGMPSAAKEGMTAWEVRKRITLLTGERRRLHILNAVCLPAIPDRASQADLAEASREFLDLVKVPYGDKKDWHSLLYLVRNSVIHNQVVLLGNEFLAALRDVNFALRRVALDAFFSFERPNDPNHFFGQSAAD